MTRYADPERCPDCRAPMAYGSLACPSCGLPLEGLLATRLFTTLSAADDILVELRATSSSMTSPEEGPATGPIQVGLGGAAGPPVPARPPRARMNAASVPKILLGLGALCLLVAALVFLAVTWAAMGVGGRTAALLAVTVVAGGLAAWAAQRDLRAAAESLSVLSLGLLAFDVFGARDAGWLGDLGTPAFLVLLGVVLFAAGAAAAMAVRRTPAGALTGAQVVAALGLLAAAAGTTDADWFSGSAGLVVVLAGSAVVAVSGRLLRLRALAAGAGLLTVLVWGLLAATSVARAVANPSLGGLWLGLEAWPLLVTIAAAAGPAALSRTPHALRLSGVGTGLVLAAVLALAPVVDEPATTAVVAGVVLVLLAAALTPVVPRTWRPATAGLHVLGALATTAAGCVLAVEAATRIRDGIGAVWSGTATDLLPEVTRASDHTVAGWTLPLLALAAVAAAGALAHTFPDVDRVVAPLADLHVLAAAIAATAVLTMGLYAVPVWSVAVLLLVTAGGFAVRALAVTALVPLLLGAAFLAGSLTVALHAESLTLLVAVATMVFAGAVHLRWPLLEVGVLAGALLPAAGAGALWTAGALRDGRAAWTALAALGALALLVLALPYVDRGSRRNGPASVVRLGVDVGALLAAAVVAAAGVAGTLVSDRATWLAVYLTLAGATASALALLRSDRRSAGWVGGLLLAAATWVRLADTGVDTPEAYTLPSALALLVTGVVHLRRHPDASTLSALSPGLGLALLPSLLWVLADPVALRSVLLGAACLVLVTAGVRLRWSAPLLHGAAVGALLALRHATPVAEAVPRWALLGTAGVLLLVMGVTWERRLRDARAVAGYVRHLQ